MDFVAVFLVGLLLFPLSAIAQSYQNVSLGSSLTTSDVTTFWPSPSGEFAFGFQRIGNGSGFLLAIWFNKITEKTIVWSANKNSLAPDGSKVQLSTNGRLVLTDPNGRKMWARPRAIAELAYGAMLDNGNFVLATSSSATAWQSFNKPTDTILRGQVLNLDNSLVSSFSDTNSSIGRFKFILQTDGNLVLYKVNYPAVDVTDAYWVTSSVGSGYQVIFNQSGYIFLQAKNGTLLNSIFSNGENPGTQSMYHRAILEYDGVFRHYVYPKTSSGMQMEWSTLYYVPENICLAISQDIGGGACGFNSLCSVVDRRPRCDCPLGYMLNDPNDKLGSCRRNFSEQDCNRESIEVEAFTFQEINNTNWPDSDYESYGGVSEDWCKQNCLSDCFCVVAIYSGNNICWKKRYPLSNGRKDPTVVGKALIKIRKDNSTMGSSTCQKRKKKNQSTLVISGSVLLASSIFMNLIALLYVFKFKGKKPKKIVVVP
ncbi:G-type lectin S-receptor-like serine/threonine-protein kinase LECRK3 [Lycium barbarum]|uniref:G-type lectin S-receptor-like serine/threonine-protein kinase LECRK3 n=1 Tax=Lycium barbarum TaxID=112863 RepID=UPI00293E74E0|nr:G-type lectin S-receptor-like serine/threonine-protein kinase LECRK3 [Lycium barbarum]